MAIRDIQQPNGNVQAFSVHLYLKCSKYSSSSVTGGSFYEDGVSESISSSPISDGSTELSNAEAQSIEDDARALADVLECFDGDNISVNLDGDTETITGNGGFNVFHVSGDFVVDSSSTLTLQGGPNDVFIFNISADSSFTINSNSEIALSGVPPCQVIFNVLGDDGSDGALIDDSLFQGTLLAAGRNVTVTSSDFGEGEGVYGAIIAGGFLNISSSDIVHDPYCPVPEPSFLYLSALGTLLLIRRRRARS